jgi:hypothetical protein
MLCSGAVWLFATVLATGGVFKPPPAVNSNENSVDDDADCYARMYGGLADVTCADAFERLPVNLAENVVEHPDRVRFDDFDNRT